ncbi:MAG: hypothetical protein QHI48_00260 [Bacteroidota bacterium]|nr:hypothetical protein [Bacteroidota bacterium]
MRRRTFVFLASFVVIAFSSASAQERTILAGSDIPGWRMVETGFYEGKELFGYIDGGAELYLEFGFERAEVQRWVFGGAELRIEAYKMMTREAAFGIASLSHVPEAIPSELWRWSWTGPRQVLFAKGEWFVTAALSGTVLPNDSTVLHDAIRALLKRIPGKEMDPPPMFQKSALRPYEARLRFVCGPVGLQTAAPEWGEVFANFKNFTLYILDFPGRYGTCTVLMATFPLAEHATNFVKKIGVRTPSRAFKDWEILTSGKKNTGVRLLFGTIAVVVEADGPSSWFRSFLNDLALR